MFIFSLLLALSHGVSREYNQEIFQKTLEYIETGAFPDPEVEVVSPILVKNTSTFQMTRDLVQRGYRPLVLDMAHASHPGGGVESGARTQEETLCRQSNLIVALRQAPYPLPERGGLLVKKVTFFRDDDYTFIDTPFVADVFVAAAYNCNKKHLPGPKGGGYDRPESEGVYKSRTLEKMRSLFRAAKQNGNDALVLGAWGCGAYKNDPVKISGWFREILNEPEFKKAFKVVSFAILGDGPNLTAFNQTFA